MTLRRCPRKKTVTDFRAAELICAGKFDLHFQYSVALVDTRHLGCSAFEDCGDVLERRVQLTVNGLKGTALAHLAADIETEA